MWRRMWREWIVWWRSIDVTIAEGEVMITIEDWWCLSDVCNVVVRAEAWQIIEVQGKVTMFTADRWCRRGSRNSAAC